MDKLKMSSSNIVNENIEFIASRFSNAIVEIKDENGKIVKAVDFDILKQELSSIVVDGDKERYTMTWPDKKQAILTANAPIAKTLRPCVEESVGKDGTNGVFDSENLYIEGDNLDVLKLLRETYLGQIKMIYIDPPYNTGNDFVYNDDFATDTEDYLIRSNQVDEEGNRMVANNDSNGRFHTDWLNMIYPRLRLARDLLKEGGSIFISIDDNEQENLKKICNEIFGESNFINQIVLKTKASAGASGGGEDKRLKKNIEYVLWYCKNQAFVDYKQPVEKTNLMDYIDEHKKEGVGFYYTRVIVNYGERTYLGSIKDGSGDEIKVYKHENFEFSSVNDLSKKENLSLEKIYNKYCNDIFMVTNAQTSLLTKVNNYVNEKNQLISYEYVPKSGKSKGRLETKLIWNQTLVVWLRDTVLNENGKLYKTEIKGTLWDNISWGRLDLEGNVPFKNGKKPTSLMQGLIEIMADKNDIVLDFFSGSASTAHSVLKYNLENNMNVKFIMVQIPELISEKSDAYKLGYKTICDIGKDRIEKAGKEIIGSRTLLDDVNKIDIGFRVLKLDSSCMKDVYYNPADIKQDLLAGLEDNIKEDRTAEDLLFQVMLDMGVLLSSEIKVLDIKGKKVFNVNDGNLICCFDKNLTEEVVTEIAQLKPLYAVFRDSSMSSDSVAVNFDQIFETYSPTTTRKII